jgi:hypothetical protein
MASPLGLHDISSTDEVRPKYVGYDNNYNLGNVQPNSVTWEFFKLNDNQPIDPS